MKKNQDAPVKAATAPKEQIDQIEKEKANPVEATYDRIQDPQVESDLIRSARNLDARFHSNWFSIMQILKKTGINTILDARQLMNMLELRGLAKKEEWHGVEKYKITISKELQIANLEQQVIDLKAQQELIITMIERLKS